MEFVASLCRAMRGSTSLLGMLILCLAPSAYAKTTTLTVADAAPGVTSSTPITIQFPVTRGGDPGVDAVLAYHTVDGTALAGTDYTAASGSIFVPSGLMSTTIPITIAGRNENLPNLTFQLLLDSAVGVGPAPTFAVPQSFVVGPDPYSIAIADINGDGKPDLIVANLYGDYGHTVSVLLSTTPTGSTTQNFASQQTFSAGYRPFSIAVADFNGDGRPDVVTADENGSYVCILLNTTPPGASSASFAAQQIFLAGMTYISEAFSVGIADINGDGKPDLAVTNPNDAAITVLLNQTTAGADTLNFSVPQAFASGSNPWHATVADVSGDGKPDLIVANFTGDTVSVLLNTTAPGAAAASFADRQAFEAGEYVQSVLAADVNGDGKPDLIATNDSSVSVLLNTSPTGAAIPSFLPPTTFDATANFGGLAVADLNGDGKPDLVVVNNNSANAAYVLTNTTVAGAATPSFASPQPFADGGRSTFLTGGDVNGDGKPDLIVANIDVGSISVLLNTTAPPTAAINFAAQQTSATGTNPVASIAADINRDWLPDVVVANQGDNTVSILVNKTVPGATMPSFAAQQVFTLESSPSSIFAADINGDSKIDLITANPTSNNVTVLLNTTAAGAAASSFAYGQNFAAGSGAASVVAVDVNSDGKIDLIVANPNDDDVSILLNTTAPGSAIPSFSSSTSAAGSKPCAVTAVDVNGDGKPDFIVTNSSGDTVSVQLNGTAPGAVTPSFAGLTAFDVGTSACGINAADINGDGLPDLIVANQDDNTVSVLVNTTVPGGTMPSFAAQQVFATALNPSSVIAADVNGDGKLDLIVSNANDFSVSVLVNHTLPGSTTPSFAVRQDFASGLSPLTVEATDLNGDGKLDLFVANSLDDTVSVLLDTQLRALIGRGQATGTIIHDYLFANDFE